MLCIFNPPVRYFRVYVFWVIERGNVQLTLTVTFFEEKEMIANFSFSAHPSEFFSKICDENYSRVDVKNLHQPILKSRSTYRWEI